MKTQVANKAMMLSAAVVLVIGLAAVSIHAQSDTPKPGPEMKKLEVFVGDWTYEGEQTDPPVADLHVGGVGKFIGTITARYILGGQFIEERYEEENPSGASSLVAIIGYDAATEKYFKNYYINDGSREASILSASADGRTWTMNLSMTTSKGATVLFRSMMAFSADGTRYTVTTQNSPDNGNTWSHWYRCEAKKVNNVDRTDGTSVGQREIRNIATFRRYWKEIVNGGDFSKHHEIISPDFTLYYAGVPDTLKGIALFEQSARDNDKAYSRIEIIEDDMVVHGDRIATQWHGVAIHDRGSIEGFEVIPDDTEVTWHGMAFYRFDEKGLITEARLLTDFYDVFRARAERATKQTAPESRNKALVRRYVDELLNNRDYSKAYEIITPDYRLYFNGKQDKRKGIDALRSDDEEEAQSGISDLTLAIEELVAEGDAVVMKWVDTALYAPPGAEGNHPKKPLKWHGMALYKFRDGRMAEGHIMNDENTILQQISSTILVTPNLDDDDVDGQPDADDDMINGPGDREDLTTIEVPFAVVRDDCIFSGPGADLYRILEMTCPDQHTTHILIEAKGPRSEHSGATLTCSGRESRDQRVSFRIDVKPFILTSSVDRAAEVFVVDVPGSRRFIEDLQAIFAKMPNAPTLTVLSNDNGDVHDVWIQDATEIGFFEGSSVFAALSGLRAKYINPEWMKPEILDRYFAKIFPGPNRCVLTVGEPLADRRWIDWFGNLESTPALPGFPWGRILTGRQNKGRFATNNDLAMQDAVMDFLKDQGAQWPPVVLNTSFLAIGHIDEIVNFIPTKTGFKAIVASPALGWQLLERLAMDGHGDGILLEGKEKDGWGHKAQTTVAEALRDAELLASNDAAAGIMAENRSTLMRELALKGEDIIDLPVVIKPSGLTLWPNPVNGLVLGNHYIASRPFGPVIGGQDCIEKAVREALAETETAVHFLDAWKAYSSEAGEVHCGTNAIHHRTRHQHDGTGSRY